MGDLTPTALLLESPSMEETLSALRAVTTFDGLPDDMLEPLAKAAIRREFAAGTMILVEGMSCEAVYIVWRGQVQVYRVSLEGRQQELASLGPGQMFNTVPVFLDNKSNHASAVAREASVLYAIPRDRFRSLLMEHGLIALAVLRDFAARLHHLTNLAEDLALRTVRGRLARFLISEADLGAVDREWTQEEMAVRLGTVRDVIGRTLRSLEDEGLVRRERQQIILLDREALMEEAGV